MVLGEFRSFRVLGGFRVSGLKALGLGFGLRKATGKIPARQSPTQIAQGSSKLIARGIPQLECRGLTSIIQGTLNP